MSLGFGTWKWAISIGCAEHQETDKFCENMTSGGETSFYCPNLHIYNLIHSWQTLYQSQHFTWPLMKIHWQSGILCHWHEMLIISCCSSVPCLHLWFLINGKMVVNPAGNTGGWFAWGFRTILIISFCSSKTSFLTLNYICYKSMWCAIKYIGFSNFLIHIIAFFAISPTKKQPKWNACHINY